ILLRVSGRKTIAQMTLAETIIMISIGTLLIQPVATSSIWLAFATGFVLILTLIVMGYSQIKIDWLEKLITGQSKILIENGKLNEQNLKRLRLTVDQLESRLRQHNITRIEDVEWATLEPSGHIGFTLKPDAQPATKKDLQQLQQSLAQLGQLNQQVKLLQQDRKSVV